MTNLINRNRLSSMKLELKRVTLKSTHTIGRLFIDNCYFCDTLEDPNRDINRDGKFTSPECKIYGNTCIPFGRYKLILSYSPRFSSKYNMWMPTLLDVPHFSGVLIHPGNTINDTHGCILVGKNKQVGKVLESKSTWYSLMNDYLIPAINIRKEDVFITII